MSLPTVCRELFDSLRPLHDLSSSDLESLETAAHVRCLLEQLCDGDVEALPFGYDETLGFERQPIVTATLHLSGEVLPHSGFDVWQRFTPDERRRAIWLASILRFAQSVAPLVRDAQPITYVTWTEAFLYLELHAPGVSVEELRHAASLSALEAVTGRSAVLGVAAEALHRVA